MKKTTLAFELREYRVRNDLSTKQMADKFNVPEQDYKRIESGSLVLSPEEEKRYRNLLAQEKLGPPKARQWYHSKAWHWIIPIVISLAGFYLLSQVVGFHKGTGINAGKTPPIKGYFVIGGAFCLCYWYFWTPVLPFKRPGGRKKIS
jgi:DNA-binding XRE family transcriptional regulator